MFVLHKLRNSCFQNIHTESKSTFAAGSFKYLHKGELKRKNLHPFRWVQVFKLLEDCKGQQFVQTQNAISNTKISSLQITRFRENRLYSGHRDIYILLFQRKNFLYEYMKIHHSCPALSFKAPVSVHSWNNAHTQACEHRLCITVLYISQHRGGKGACTW